jgi:hypothetical protein
MDCFRFDGSYEWSHKILYWKLNKEEENHYNLLTEIKDARSCVVDVTVSSMAVLNN